MNKKGFTLVEMLAVIVILGILLVAGGMTFFNIIGSREEFETEELYEYFNSAAYAYSAANQITGTITVTELINKGYLSESYGIMNEKKIKEICSDNTCEINIMIEDGERKTCVATFNNEPAKGKGAC